MFCWICCKQVGEFLPYGLPPRRGRCPHCGAKPRGRLLGWLLKRVLCPRLPTGSQLMEVGASKFSVEHLLTAEFLDGHRCTVIDLRRLGHHRRLQPPYGFVQMDLVQMGFRSNSFDLILCNNTLPYVSDDHRALREIHRCLKPEGLAIINTHREPGPTISAIEHRRLHPELEESYYAVNGDQWVYGDDFFDRVGEAELGCTRVRVFGSQPDEFLVSNGLKRYNELIFAYTDSRALERCRHPEIELE